MRNIFRSTLSLCCLLFATKQQQRHETALSFIVNQYESISHDSQTNMIDNQSSHILKIITTNQGTVQLR
jgi:hypothetical protein